MIHLRLREEKLKDKKVKDKMLRVGIILRYLWIAGAPKIAIYQTRGLIKQGCNAELLILAVSPRYRGEYDALLCNVPHKILKVPRILEMLEIKMTNLLFRKLRENERVLPLTTIPLAIKYARKYDLLLCHDPFSGFVGLLCKIFFKIPYVIYLHEAPIRHYLLRPLEVIVIKNAAIVLTVTHKVAGVVRSILRDKVKVKALPPGFPVILRKQRTRSDYVLAASRWDIYRTPFWIISLAREIRNMKFLVLGYWQSMILYQKIKQQASNYDNIIICKRPVKEELLNKIIDKSLAVIRFHKTEHGIATITWEAVHRGVPVIVNKELGVAPYIRKYGAGVVINKLDHQEVKKALTEIWINYEKYIENCYRLAEAFSMSAHAKKLIEIFRNLISR